jgi:predicted tellurium resistance membrane protein TerC
MPVAIDLENVFATFSLVALVLLLGVDNVVAITVITRRVPSNQQRRVRLIGLGLAALFRIILLLMIVFVLSIADWNLYIFDREINLRRKLLLLGGLFLLTKSGWELFHRLQPQLTQHSDSQSILTLRSAVLQIVLIDLTLSLDSLFTVATLASHLGLMIAAIVIEVVVILFFSVRVARLLTNYPSLETLAICALGLVGIVLVSEGLDWSLQRSHIYLMLLFAIFVQLVNIRIEMVSSRESDLT